MQLRAPRLRQDLADARAEAAARAFLETVGDSARFERRRAEIAALPVVTWKGRELRQLTCRGDFGRGPHVVNVPLAVCWGLISLDRFLCPFHR